MDAARDSGGAVDPTVGSALCELGYDRDLAEIDLDGQSIPLVFKKVPGWRSITLNGNELTIPQGVLVDLGATAKAFAADSCAHLVAGMCDTGVLVSLGGDIATAGPAPVGGWQVLVQDQPDDPSCVVAMPTGRAIATSSTRSRQWRRGNRVLHHVLDPTTCQPASTTWRCATVVADRCVDSNMMTTAALVRGEQAPSWLRERGVPARLVAADGEVVKIGGWP